MEKDSSDSRKKIIRLSEKGMKFNSATENLSRQLISSAFSSFSDNEKEELENMKLNHIEVLGDIVISIQKVKEQAIEYGHSFERELSYMVVHGFYHIIGYDHIEEKDKIIMRPKEEHILNLLNQKRD